MTALDQGIDFKLPRGSSVFMRGWCILLSADYPAAAVCCGFKKSASAAVFCRECYCNQKDKTYPSPTSFLDSVLGNGSNAHLKCELCLRDQEQMVADFNHYRSLSSKKQAKKKQGKGGMTGEVVGRNRLHLVSVPPIQKLVPS